MPLKYPNPLLTESDTTYTETANYTVLVSIHTPKSIQISIIKLSKYIYIKIILCIIKLYIYTHILIINTYVHMHAYTQIHIKLKNVTRSGKEHLAHLE